MDMTQKYLEATKVNYCPHGYGECQQGCAYPGRCGRFVEAPKVGTLKLSDAIRECGYGRPMDANDCVIGRAHRRLTGDGWPSGPYHKIAAKAFGVPVEVIWKAEWMCFDHRPPSEIAAFVASEGY